MVALGRVRVQMGVLLGSYGDMIPIALIPPPASLDPLQRADLVELRELRVTGIPAIAVLPPKLQDDLDIPRSKDQLFTLGSQA